MCGIAGIIRFYRNIVSKKVLESMARALSHRGPNNHGVVLKTNIGIGHRRLSIIDPVDGTQLASVLLLFVFV